MKISTRLLHVALLLSGLTVASRPVQATDYVWSGSTSGVATDWSSNKNWKIAASTTPIDKLSLAPGATEDAALSGDSAQKLSGVPGAGDTATLTAGAVVTTGTPLTLAKLTVEGGSILRGNADITVTSSLVVRDAQLLGAGNLIIESDATAIISSQKTGDSAGSVLNKAIDNRGTVNWVSGKFALQKDFRNKGTFNISAGAAMQSAAIATAATATFHNEGTLVKSGAGRSAISLPFNNSGEVYLRSGILDVGPKYVQSDGSLHLDGGDLSSSGTLQIEGGTVGGSGTFDCSVVNSGGTIKPGHSPGIMVIQGNYTQTANGTLGMEVGGNQPGTGYDQMQIWGSAFLGGRLDIVKFNNYAPYAGQSFEFLHCYEINDTFTSFTGLYPGGSLYYKIMYTGDSFIASVFSDNTAPTVSISNPINHESYLGVSSIKGVANDVTFASGVKSVTVIVYRHSKPGVPAGHLLPGNTWTPTMSAANQLLATGTKTWTLPLPFLDPGLYHAKATATDNVGRTTSTANVFFTVSPSGSGYVSFPTIPAKDLRLASLVSN